MEISPHFLISALCFEGFLLATAIALILGHSIWLRRHRQQSERLLDRAHVVLAEILDEAPNRIEDGQAVDSRLDFLRDLPVGLLITLLARLDQTIRGDGRKWLNRLGQETGLIALAEGFCASMFWWRRLEGARLLTLLNYENSSMLHLLSDPHPVVRAQAVEWTAQHPTPAAIDKLLVMAGDRSGLCRFAVLDALTRLRQHAVEPMFKFLSVQSGPSTAVALEAAAWIPDPMFLAPALKLRSNPYPQVRARAASLLGTLGGNESADVLLGMLTDSSPQVRAAVAHALGKLHHWPAATALAESLRDKSWQVRREAGLALRAVGSPGILLLRRALTDRDRFAVDMAMQVLDLPEPSGKAQAQWA